MSNEITYEELKQVINKEPKVRVISTGDIVTCITCDGIGAMCDSDYGTEDYDYDEIEKIDGEWKYE